MPYLLTLDEETIPLADNQPFTVGDTQYPANVLTLWSREELEAIGLVWVEPEPAPVDWISPARDALAASDITVLRCVEQGVAVPEAWATYRAALREVVRTGEGPLPERPDWP